MSSDRLRRAEAAPETTMPDLMWIAIMAGLAAATLAYARLCDDA